MKGDTGMAQNMKKERTRGYYTAKTHMTPSLYVCVYLYKYDHRAKNLCSTQHTVTEHKTLCRTLQSNNYPNRLMQRVINKEPDVSEKVQEKNVSGSIVMTYVRGLSEAVQCLLYPLGIRVVYRPDSIQLVRVKDPVPHLKQAYVV